MKPCSKHRCVYTWIFWIAIFLCIGFVIYVMFVCQNCVKRRLSRAEAMQMKESFDDGNQKLVLLNHDSLGEFHQTRSSFRKTKLPAELVVLGDRRSLCVGYASQKPTDRVQMDEVLQVTQETSDIPNKIWIFWSSPEGSMNHIVEKCIESWKHHHPTYEIILLDKNNCGKYIDIDINTLRHAKENNTRFSDFLRCLILSKHGGFWVDASIICHHPVSWVHAIQRNYRVEFVGYYTGSDTSTSFPRYPSVENWFFACVPNSVFMRDWCQEFLRFNEFASANDYLTDLRKQGINLDNMPYLEYLTMHASAQYILQKNPDSYRIYLFSANAGPLLYLEQVKWDYERAVDLLTNTDTCESFYQYTMIKLPNGPRDAMLHRKPLDIQRAFSHK